MLEACRTLINARHPSKPPRPKAASAALALTLAALVFVEPLVAQPADRLFRSADLPADEDARAAILELQQKGLNHTVVRSRLVELDLALLQQNLKAESATRQDAPLRLDFFPGVEAPLVIDDARRDDLGFTLYHGSTLGASKDANPGSVVLVERDGALAGTFEVGERFFSLRHAGGSIHLLEELDRARFAPGAEPLIPELQLPLKVQASGTESGETKSGRQEIDILVAYTKTARQAAGSVSAIQHQVILAISQLEAALSRSQADATARLAGLVEIDYPETGNPYTDLGWLRTTSETAPFKSSWQADVVSLFVENMSGACGLGYVMTSNSPSFAPLAVNVVQRWCATGNYSFAHEVGHNLGAMHDRANSSFPGAFSYSYGYQAPSREFRTVMAYDCSGSHCPRILNFSNPAVSHDHQPTGVSASAPNSADNALTFRQTGSTVAGFSNRLPQASFGQYDVSSGYGFANLDPGYTHRPTFVVDVTADGRADYCRFVGDYHTPFLSCAAATASGTFGQYDVNSSGLDLGYGHLPTFMADVDADGRADYCRFVGDPHAPFLSCATATASGTFGQYDVNSSGLDVGYTIMPSFMADANGDGRADYCRFVGDYHRPFLSCAAANANGTFGQYDVNSPPLDQGYGHMPRLMADVNADGRADYCRFVGDAPNIFFSCATAKADGTFGQYDINSAQGFAGIDPGRADMPRLLADVNADGRADYCRFVGDAPYNFLSCALATATGTFGNYDVNSRQGTPAGLDFGYGHLPIAMADVDASGKSSYCRFVGDPSNLAFSCATPVISP
ncbi:MAG: M12 family metallo-peptidase, partial [Acidobacteriota bacterium]